MLFSNCNNEYTVPPLFPSFRSHDYHRRAVEAVEAVEAIEASLQRRSVTSINTAAIKLRRIAMHEID